MAVRVRWANDEKTVLYADHQGDFDTAMVIDYIKAAYDMIETVEHDVAIVADVRGHGNLLDGMITRFRSMADLVHPRTKHTYFVGMRGLSHTVTSIYANVFKRITLVDTPEEAFELLGLTHLLFDLAA